MIITFKKTTNFKVLKHLRVLGDLIILWLLTRSVCCHISDFLAGEPTSHSLSFTLFVPVCTSLWGEFTVSWFISSYLRDAVTAVRLCWTSVSGCLVIRPLCLEETMMMFALLPLPPLTSSLMFFFKEEVRRKTLSGVLLWISRKQKWAGVCHFYDFQKSHNEEHKN